MRENELLRKIAKGETEYWEELIGMYYEDILRYCIYHAPDKTAAEDAESVAGSETEHRQAAHETVCRLFLGIEGRCF